MAPAIRRAKRSGRAAGGGAARIVRQLAKTWKAPGLRRVPIAVSPRLNRTLGRLRLRPLAIQLSTIAFISPHRIEIITHEAAHAVLALAGKANSTRPHGPEWRRLMALAGFPKAKATRPRACMPRPPAQSHARYEHRCPVCQTTRTAKRPVPQWRCAACVDAGLPGRLVVQRAAGPRHPEGAKRPKDLVPPTTRSFAPHGQTEGRSG